MTSADLLRKLFESHRRRDDQAFAWVAQQVISEERQKHHNLLADDLARILEGPIPPHAVRSLPHRSLPRVDDLPRDKESGAPLVEIRHPSRALEEMVLSPTNTTAVCEITREFQRADVLRTHGLQPRRTLLFCGPPGCGKTLCAEVIAHELHLPLLYTRFDSIISSYLGETAANLRKVFEFASRDTWVLFFDEFDAIGKSRDDTTEHGELKRVVNSFLQLMDAFASESLVIAATNHQALLDSALWRRFDEILLFKQPSRAEIPPLVEKKLGAIRHERFQSARLVQLLKGLSHADIERICRDVARDILMQGEEVVSWADFRAAIERHHRRLEVAAGSDEVCTERGAGGEDVE